LWELGAEVIKIGAEPNGLNINFEVGSTVSQAAPDVGLGSSNDLPAIEDCDMAGGL
jgi:phosphoglucosamine mutase